MAAQVSESLTDWDVDGRSRSFSTGPASISPVTRVWWVLRAYGIDKVSILDGGWSKRQREGRPVSTADRVVARGDVSATLQPNRLANRHQVLAAIGDPGISIVNALSAEQHQGSGGSTFGRPGRIAGTTANLNPERKTPSMFEPIHGSAFDITGKGIANPVGTFWTAAMMLEHLGEKSAAVRLMKAVERVTADPSLHTPDLGGKATTKQVTEAVCEELRKAND